MDFERQLEKIVHRCRDGERAAFEELFEIYQPRLKYYVRRLDDGGVNTDDMLQDIWLTVFKKIHKLKNAQSFAAWLYRIARNKVYDRFRRKDRFVSLPEEDEFSVSIILSYISTLLNITERFYKRQFNTRKTIYNELTSEFLQLLKN